MLDDKLINEVADYVLNDLIGDNNSETRRLRAHGSRETLEDYTNRVLYPKLKSRFV